MIGNNRKGIVIQDRDRQLLRELAIMRLIDREQAKCVAGFRSTRRVNSRLLILTRAGLLRRFFLGTKGGGQKALYALSPTGAKLVDVPFRGPRRAHDEILVADFFVMHQLSINEINCLLKYRPIPPPRRSSCDGGASRSRSSPVPASFRMAMSKFAHRTRQLTHSSRSIWGMKDFRSGKQRSKPICGTPSRETSQNDSARPNFGCSQS